MKRSKKFIIEDAFKGDSVLETTHRISFNPPTRGELHFKSIVEVIDKFRMFRHHTEETKQSLVVAFCVLTGKHNLSLPKKLKYTASNIISFKQFLVELKETYTRDILPKQRQKSRV